ncbi:hypothetical protein N8I77_007775 [Diaporthe amygdali]|uniref:Uncharacterized protein n=1 Tax=Phomopsis amygdali TaxID=1214568 RepID=A0AAD9W3S1_PHOAM|nr:hypothetical protein N8I77_007775 [Diaporthe amygdali]
MGRGATWPPNSLSEWMVGQNFKSTPRRSSGQTQILKVSLSEDETSGDETLQITYSGRRRTGSATIQATPQSSSRKKVSFDNDRKPLKSALKKRAVSPSDSSDTLIEDTSEDATTTEKDESSAIDESDTSEDEVWVKKKKPKAENKPKAAPVCKKETDSEDSSAVKDALPHETCDCKDCVMGRKILKAMIKLDAKKAADGDSKKVNNEKQKGKQKGSKKKDDATSTEVSETTETEATEEDKEKPSKQKKKKEEPKENEKKSSSKENKKPSPKTEEQKQTVDKNAFKLPTYPKFMEPNLIMPIKSKVVQCEHAIEGPNDPRPNAFIDSGKGIVRVYHGPVWGNHTGELYGAANPSKLPPLPPSAVPYHGYPPNWAGPHHYGHFAPYPPYPPGGPSPRFHPARPPPGTPIGHNTAAGGLGLTGIPWPGTPPTLREERAREKAKARSEATNNVGPSQGSVPQNKAQNGNTGAWDSGGGKQGWGNDGNVNGSGNAWAQAAGGDNNTQEHDFSFLRKEKPQWERLSNKSAKGSQNNGWAGGGGGNSWNQQNGNQAGDNAWGQQTGNSGWNETGGGKAANDDQNWGIGSNHGSNGNANKDQGWNTQGSKHNSPQGWDTNNGQGWNQQGSNRNSPQGGNASNGQNWNQQGPNRSSPQGWNANNGQSWSQQGPNHNSPQAGDTWGGPPGSKPQSHHSRHPSNAGGGWDYSGWAMGHDNRNNNSNGLPGHMPGSWDNNGGTQSQKHSGSHQPSQGWNQHGNVNSPRSGDNGGHGWNGPSAPQGPQFSGQGGGQGWGAGSFKGGSPAANWNAGGGGAGGGWDENPSNNAGPTTTSWEANIAGDTKGAATNW